MAFPESVSGTSGVQYWSLDDLNSARSQNKLAHLWSCIVSWFCPTAERDAKLRLYTLFHGESERAKMVAFLDLQSLAGAGCKDNFIIGKNEHDGMGRLSIVVPGEAGWHLDFQCEVGVCQELKNFGKSFIREAALRCGADKHAECVKQTDADLPRAKVTVGEEEFQHNGAGDEAGKAAHIELVKAKLRECLPPTCFDVVIRLLSQGSFSPQMALHTEAELQGAHGSVVGSPTSNLVGSYEVKVAKSGVDVTYVLDSGEMANIYVNNEVIATDPSASFVRSKVTVHLNSQGKIVGCTPCEIHSNYRFSNPLDYMRALTIVTDTQERS